MNACEPQLSVVVPLYNEVDNVLPLVEAITEALAGCEPWELILVDDGSTDGTAAVAHRIADDDGRIRLIRLARNYGQTPAMQAGFDHVRGRVVVSMDGDLQNDPRDIPLLAAKLDEGYDLVAGYRRGRKDKLVTRKIPSWIANRLIQRITQVRIRDNGCSLKAYRVDLLRRINLYSDMHRFIPAVAAATAGARIAEVPVRHHARKHGSSKYGLSRILKVLADLLTIKMIRSFRDRPLAMLAAGSLLATLLAGATGAAAIVAAVGFGPEKANAVVFSGTALLWLGLAGYLLMLGLIAEVALWEHRRENGEQLPLVHEEQH
ncbi:MAG: glycosyltransferase family 2 protein [Gemmatimonadota bacterium]|nr:MAG: glycosyltransferase family 2 protein [Gemmatimonadota bacterium]